MTPKARAQEAMDDPYHDIKPYHSAHLINENGDVSPLCAKTPRKLNLRRELWTTDKSAVTCKKCAAILAAVEKMEKK